MQNKFTISIPKGDTIKEDLQKLIGRQSLSSAIIQAMHDYKNNRSGNKDGKTNLPDWRTWKKHCTELGVTELEEIIVRLNHLKVIADKAISYNTDTVDLMV